MAIATRRGKRFVGSGLTAAFVIYATVPSATKWEITEVILTNDSTTVVTLIKIRIGGVTWWEQSVAVSTSVRLPFFTIANAGENIQAVGATSCGLFISGIEVSPV